MSRETEPYRPSNGTEGEIFMHNWCERCAKDAAHRRDENKPGCRIITYMMAFDVGDKEYPKQIVQTANVPWEARNPRCTAFREVGVAGVSRKPAKQKPPETLALFQPNAALVAECERRGGHD